MIEIRLVDQTMMNRWMKENHYLHRPMIRTKLLAHGVYHADQLVGGLLWATPHFTRKLGLFGMPGTLDKWEVLMLARFYLIPNSGLDASAVLAASIGKAGTDPHGSKRRGWRVQEDWVKTHPPIFPQSPFVPRLLISWADSALLPVAVCATCGAAHNGAHRGTIYKACGWRLWDTTTRNARRHDSPETNDAAKHCYILHLGRNPRAYNSGILRWWRNRPRPVPPSTTQQLPLFT